MHLSAKSHFVYSGSVLSGLVSSLPLGVVKLLLQSLNLKQKEHNLTVKTTVKRNKYLHSLPFRTWRCFQSYLASPCVSSRTQSKVLLKRAFREDTSNGHVLGHERARPPKKTSGRWRCSREKMFKKMMSKVPGIKLVKLLIALIEKIHCSIVNVLINLY